MLKTYMYPVYNKNGTVGQKKVTRQIKKIQRSKEEIADIQKLYDAGFKIKIILKKHKISLYNFHKLINTSIPPAHPGDIEKLI